VLLALMLLGLYTFNNGVKTRQARLHQVALRTFIGSCLTLVSTLGYVYGISFSLFVLVSCLFLTPRK
jgi:hypothetical protein